MKRVFCRFSIFLFCLFSILSAWGQNVELTELIKSLEYRNVGPTRGGRVTAVSGFANKPGSFLFGSTGGGVWKSTNYGQSWKNISDGYFETASIGAITVANSNSDIIYVGTGSDGIRSNVITGKGVYKSLDGGKVWTFAGLKNTGQIGAVEVHPSNPDVVFVAAIGQAFAPNKERGVFKSIDGGQNWKNVLFVSDSTGAVDLEFHPANPNIIYASMWRAQRKPWTIISGGFEGGIYKSEDGGESWNKLTNGLPSGLFGKSDLAVSLNKPNRVWALIEAPEGKGGVYRSDDQGASFELVSTKKQLLDRPFYYCNIETNPLNADVLYVNATQYWKSEDAGKKWKRKSTPHGDNHDVWINPNDTLEMIQANDGGANVTRDGGQSWSSQSNQATAELYQVEVDDQTPYWLYAGQQDNSTIMVPSLPPYNSISGASGYWKAIGGCETGPAVPKPGNPDIVYSNCKGRFGVYNKKTGQEMQYYVGAANMYGHNPKNLKFRFQRVSPIHVSPHDPDVVYHASQYLHKTIDDGKTWEIISPDLTAFTPETQQISGSPITRDITGEEFYSTIYAIRESNLEEGLIWVGANDGPVHVTKNGGKDWKKVTPGALAPGGRVQTVEPSPHNPAKAYIAVYRYLLGDWKPYLFKTEDYGNSWTLLTPGNNGIPADYPTRVIREDPEKEGLLYAGTEFGMYISADDGKSWSRFQQNLPVTPITDLKVHQGDLIVSTMGRSFWILDNLSPLHQNNKKANKGNVVLFKPQDTYRMRYRPNSKSSQPYYPRAGVDIDYFLGDEKPMTVNIEILKDNKVVRSFTSKPNPGEAKVKDQADMATGFRANGAQAVLKNSKGIHRFRWDMRHNGPKGGSNSRFGNSGPMVSPGAYAIRLRYDKNEIMQSFSVLMDPRIKEAGLSQKDFSAQEELALKVRELLSEAQLLAKEVASMKKNAQKKTVEPSSAPEVSIDEAKLNKIQEELVTPEGRYRKPGMIDQIRYLYSMLDRADQMPGKDAFDRYNELHQLFKALPVIKKTQTKSD